MPIFALLTTFALACAVSAGLSIVAIQVGLTLGIADTPGGRRRHTRVTSRLGALPLFGGFVAATLIAQRFAVPTTDAANESTRLWGLLLGAGIVFVLGIVDDRFELSGRAQLPFQIIAALVAFFSLIFIERFRSPFNQTEIVLPVYFGPGLEWLGWGMVAALTLFWFIGMMNTVNLLDGVDGLVGSVSLVAAVVTLLHMLREGQYSVALLPMALIGALTGFLLFNFQPARLFLGGGALFVGFVLASTGIIAGAKIALLLLVMGLPIADVLWQIIDRIRHGRSPASGDRGHLHLRLADRGWSPRKIVVVYAGASATFGAIALSPQTPGVKLVTLAVLFAAVIVLLIRLSRVSRQIPS